MPCDLPSSPHLLERATQGDLAALSTVVCAHKERAYMLAAALSPDGPMDGELASDVTATLEELADQCSSLPEPRTRSSRASSPFEGSAPISLVERARESARPGTMLARRTLFRRWHLLYTLCCAIAALPHEHRALLVLVDMEGLEGDQVAWLLGLSEAETVDRLRQARALLREQLQRGSDDRKSA